MKSEVVIGVVTNGSKVLLVKRKEGEGKLRWQFPGGGLEANESDEQALVRELIEETGCSIIPTRLLGQRIHPYTNKFISYWICDYISGDIRVSDKDLEEAKWVETSEILNYFTTPVYPPILEYLGISKS